MASIALQLLIFLINISRDYILAIHSVAALNYLIVALAVMGLISSGLLDLVMVRSINFGGLGKYVFTICGTLLILLFFRGHDRYIQYAYFLSCALLNIVIFSNALQSTSTFYKRQIALLQIAIIFSIVFFVDEYHYSIPIIFFISAVAPLLFILIPMSSNQASNPEGHGLVSFNRWIILKIFLSLFVSAFIIIIANFDSGLQVSVALRFLSYTITAANIIIPVIFVDNLMIGFGRKIMFYAFSLPVFFIFSLGVAYENPLIFCVALCAGLYLLCYVWLCSKILIANNVSEEFFKN